MAADGATVKPLTLLIIFATIQLITYLDRGIISTYLADIQDDYNLSGLQAGTLAGAYMVGYVAASPVFAHYGSSYHPMTLIAAGLLVWSLAVVGTGISAEYGTILIARTFTGVGEASFACLAPPLIDLKAPADKKSLWMAIFYINIPVGYAMGYLLAGQWESSHAVHGTVIWRIPFIFVGVVLIPFVAYVFSKRSDGSLHYQKKRKLSNADSVTSSADLKEYDESLLNGEKEDEGERVMESDTYLADPLSPESHRGEIKAMRTSSAHKSQGKTFKQKLKVVLNNRIYVLIVLGYAAQTFVVGGFAYWGIEYVEGALHLDESTATLSFGGLTVLTGVLGTASGGILLDYLRKRAMRPGTDPSLEISIATEKAMMVLAVCSVLSLPCVVIGIGTNTPAGFFPMTGIGQFLIFMCLTPINSTIVWITPYQVAPLALAISVLCNHMLGDAISPILIGEVLDSTNRDWRTTFVLVAFWLLWPILCWVPAWYFARKDLRKAESANRI